MDVKFDSMQTKIDSKFDLVDYKLAQLKDEAAKQVSQPVLAICVKA
jgi:hypothetical protein